MAKLASLLFSGNNNPPKTTQPKPKPKPVSYSTSPSTLGGLFGGGVTNNPNTPTGPATAPDPSGVVFNPFQYGDPSKQPSSGVSPSTAPFTPPAVAFNPFSVGNSWKQPAGGSGAYNTPTATTTSLYQGPSQSAPNTPYAPIGAHAIVDGISQIGGAYNSAMNNGYNPSSDISYSGGNSNTGASSLGTQNPYQTDANLLNQQNAAKYGTAPDQTALYDSNATNSSGGLPYTYQEMQQQRDAESADYGNLESNYTNSLAWQTFGGSGSSSTGTSNPFASSGGSDPTQTYVQALTQGGIQGASADTSLSQVLSTPQGQQAWLQGVYTNEGGTPQGSYNAGNIIVTPSNANWIASLGGTAGKAVPSQPGNYYANFPTQAAGDQATLAVAQNYLKSNPNMTVGQAAQKYTGYSAGGSTQDKTNFYNQYGLLSNSQEFNPNDGNDINAYNYLLTLEQTGKAPTLSPSAGVVAQARFQNTTKTVNALLSSIGVGMPSEEDITANKAAYTNNVKVLNNLNTTATGLVSNFGLNLQNMTANDINGSNQIVNGINDAFKNLAGDPAMAQYFAQNRTVANELGNLLGVKNGSGTTVADKIQSDGIINPKATLAQQKQIFDILLKEKDNIENAYISQNQSLYNSIDPLQILADNPLKKATISQLNAADQSSPNGGTTANGLTYTIQ